MQEPSLQNAAGARVNFEDAHQDKLVLADLSCGSLENEMSTSRCWYSDLSTKLGTWAAHGKTAARRWEQSARVSMDDARNVSAYLDAVCPLLSGER